LGDKKPGENIFGILCECDHFKTEHLLIGFTKPYDDAELVNEPLEDNRSKCSKCSCGQYIPRKQKHWWSRK